MNLLLHTVLTLAFSYSVSAQCLGPDDSLPSRKNLEDPERSLQGTYKFSIDLFKSIYDQTKDAQVKDNIFISPFSIWNALLLAYFGARGETKTQLETALGLTGYTKLEAVRAYRQLMFWYEARKRGNKEQRGPKYDFELANRAYVDQNLPFKMCMKDILNEELQFVDFVNETEKARLDINAWVKQKTRNRIQDIIPPGAVDPTTAFALVNAAYFKGKWSNQFKPIHTMQDLFYPTTSQADLTFVEMMYQKAQFRYGASEELQAYILELPYVGDDMSMYVLLPPYVQGGLDNLMSRLTPENLEVAIGNMFPSTIQVYLPKFKMERTYEVKEVLEAINITDIFDAGKSNLRGFADISGLHVGSAIHKSFIKVDEEGSEAAAATALISFRMARPVEPEKFVANHPFVYLIYDNSANTILFMGIMRNPKLG